MGPYYTLIPCFVFFCIGSYMAYTPAVRNGQAYVWTMGMLGCITGFLFAYASKLLNDNSKIYVYSLVYDSMMVAAYYLLPILAFGTKINTGVMVGAAMIVVGFSVVKVYAD